jgi:CRP/FNR family transcriptional regulator
MIDTGAELRRLYPALANLDERTFAAAVAQVQVVDLPAGTQLFAEGSVCRQFPLVLSGSIRVAKVGEGRELQLYRVVPGESCVLTSSCLVGSRDYPATGVVESDVRLVVLPQAVFEQLMTQHPPFRQYVFGLFAERLTDLMGLVEAIAFHRLDRRLAAALLGHGKLIEATHQQLADELGSVREIVTRVLRNFADQGLVRVGRGSLEVLDAAGLRKIAAGE